MLYIFFINTQQFDMDPEKLEEMIEIFDWIEVECLFFVLT